VAVSFAVPDDALVAGLTFEVDYPATALDLPGEGTGVPQHAFTGAPTGAVVGANDLGSMVRVTVARAQAIPPGPLVTLRFRPCKSALAGKPDGLSCRVVGTSDPSSNRVDGVTCHATLVP